MSRIPLSVEELEGHLSDQIAFLEASAASFDRGFEAEASRMAVVLRILFHDRRNSKSLLGQLGKKDDKFVSTAIPLDPNNLATHGGLVSIALGPPRTRYVAMLDDVPWRSTRGFLEWWEEKVFVDEQRRSMTREQLVRSMADQDGGAHVDPAIDEQYHALIKGNALNWMASDGLSFHPMKDPARAAIRQIAHETLASLKPGYRKVAEHDAGAIVSGVSVVAGQDSSVPQQPESAHVMQQRQKFGKVRRNTQCPCGSGKKYKKCHGHHS